MYSVQEVVGTAEVTQGGVVGGGLTLLVPTLGGCMQSSWSFSVTTRCGLGLLRRRAGLLWLRGWGRRLGSGLRCRLAYLRSGGELCDGSRCSLGCRWRCGGVGGSRRGCSVRWGSSCRGSCPRFARLRCSQSLHDGGDPHSFLQEEGEQAEFKDGTVTWKLTQRTSTLTGFPQHYYSFLIKELHNYCWNLWWGASWRREQKGSPST